MAGKKKDYDTETSIVFKFLYAFLYSFTIRILVRPVSLAKVSSLKRAR